VLTTANSGLSKLSQLLPDKDSLLWGNLIYAILLSLIVVITEQSYRIFTDGLHVDFIFSDGLEIFIFFLLISFVRLNWIRNLVIGFYLTFSLLQMFHFSYFGAWIFPIEILLFFQKTNETFSTFSSVFYLFYMPLILSVVAVILVVTLLRVPLPRKHSAIALFLLMLLITSSVLKPAISLSTSSSRPDFDHSILRNSFLTVGYFFGKTLPDYMRGISHTQAYLKTPYKREVIEPKANVILIVGESLNVDNLSLFGYPRKTTPNLELMTDEPQFVYKKAYASGVLTDVSLPSLINMIAQPDGTEQIIRGHTNLFRMAKANGFVTHFISAQTDDDLKFVKSYLFPASIDNFFTADSPENTSNEKHFDSILLDQLREIDLKKSNFIVLQQAGSHSPYRDRVPEDKKFFQENNLLDEYDNTIRYSDLILSRIVEFLKRRCNTPCYVVFTSNHGQAVEKNSYGHGSIENPKHYIVPFFVFAINGEMNPVLVDNIKHAPLVGHFDIANLTAYFLGYETKPFSSPSRNVFVNGPELNGNSGYLQILMDSTGNVRNNRVE